MSTYSYIFKFITVGDSGVGKSCLLLQFTDRRFRADHDITIGVEFGAKTISVNDKNLKIQIWDTAGQENFLSVTRAYYRGSVAALLVYDVSSRSSFESLGRWLTEIQNNAGEAVSVILVANKIDLADREVQTEEGQSFANEKGLLYIETSAKTGMNVAEAFTELAKVVLSNINAGKYDLGSEFCGIKVGKATVKDSIQAAERRRRCRC
mmetsp:Transcript_25728/g.45157  ORF Transcript_25728/g.45157 Transcript_25728/m.45157 type:complete len:208 (+) Transcript_25728:794-1417(+)